MFQCRVELLFKAKNWLCWNVEFVPLIFKFCLSQPQTWYLWSMHTFVVFFKLECVRLIKQCSDSLQNLESLNLNGCQKISDKGVEAITTICPNLKVFSIYWNVRYFKLTNLCPYICVTPINLEKPNWWVCLYKSNFRFTDIGIEHLVKNCKRIVGLNLSGCKVHDHLLMQVLSIYLSLS